MFDAGRRGVDDAEVVSAGAAIVCRRSVVPDDDHLLGGLEVSDGADVAFAAVLESFVKRSDSNP